jgi:hypothetical protein
MLVRFDVISLFARVLLKDALNILSQNSDENILRLFRTVLTSHYFSVSTGSSTNRPMEYPWDDPYALRLHISS